MVPLRFGKLSRRLFGLYQAPSENDDRKQSVLLCNPFGQEAIRCHRLLRVLGDRLSREGFHVLRFDYFGTGDSEGDDLDVTLAGWEDDLLQASDELVGRSGHSRISWFGLRLGGTVAALASAQRPNAIQQLVMWEPVLQGPEYISELEAAHANYLRLEFNVFGRRPQALRGELPPGTATQILGFPISPEMRLQIDAVSPTSLAVLRAGRVSILSAAGHEAVRGFEGCLLQRNVVPNYLPLQTKILWASDEAMSSAIVPAEVLNTIVACLRDRT